MRPETRSARADHAPGVGRRSCLVAVDGTRSGVAALVWALRHAADTDMDVEVLTVWPPHRSVLIHEVPGHFCAARWSAVSAQERTVRQAVHDISTPPRITMRLENADAGEAIVRASTSHDLVVLGSDRKGGAHRLTDRVVRDATCEVVVLSPPDTGPAAASPRPHRRSSCVDGPLSPADGLSARVDSRSTDVSPTPQE